MTAPIRVFDVDEGVLLDEVSLGPADLAGGYSTIGKRILDVTLVILTSVISLPLIAALACLVMLDGRSAFFRQERIGRNGSSFQMWKLRSMHAGADALLRHHLAQDPAAAQEWAHHQKLRNDPRVTRFGRFLRKTSLDELPQLWNVLKGEMSLVGPRPMMREQAHLYSGEPYYKLRPGMTGLWQVAARNASGFEARAIFDGAYAKRIGLWFDLVLIGRTVGVVLRGTGQ
ncbi:MAG: sugar transferase [Pseudomonadota bacterium]